MTTIDEIKMLIRERNEEDRYFSDEEIRFYYRKNNEDIYDTVYELLIIKAEDNSCKLPNGVEVASSKEYYLTLARKYRRNKSRVI